MDRSHPYALGAAVVAVAIGFTICASAAVPSSNVGIEAAHERVNEARVRDNVDSLALESALTALGDASLEASRYATAEAAYAEALQLAEQQGEREGERALPALIGLGKARAEAGHHEEAIPVLQRALTITRTQYGLFDLRQQDVLKSLAVSLTALERVPEAQELMLYRVRTAEKNYGEGNPKVIPAVCDLGDWFSEAGMYLQARMAYYMALNIVGATGSLEAPIIVEPLRGIARTRMRALSDPEFELPRRPAPVSYSKKMGAVSGKPRNPRVAFDREGEQALKRALRIVEADPAASPRTRIETLIEMGDWYQIKKLPREALPYYQRAWQLSRTTPSALGFASTTLNVPVRVYYPTPQIVSDAPAAHVKELQAHYVQVEFTVAADGSVQDARIAERDANDRDAQEIFDAVREARFRPKFVDGQPAAAPGITYREAFWTDTSRE
jgi:tetratricopeptide (TPR) repeat protein